MPMCHPCQIQAGSLLLALPLDCSLIPGPMAPCPTASCPTAPSPMAPCPMAFCSPKDLPDLPSQSLCFPSLEASGSEAQVSKVKKKTISSSSNCPCFVLFPDSSQTALEARLLPLGQPTGAVVALPGTQGHSSKYEPPVSSPKPSHEWVWEPGAFPRELPAPWAQQMQAGQAQSCSLAQPNMPEGGWTALQ